jgi:hypothetical protein
MRRQSHWTTRALTAAAMLAGCASTQSLAPPEHCSAPLPAGMARVIVLRVNSSLGGANSIGVHDDGQTIGQLGPGGRLCWMRHAGTAYVTAYLTAQAPHSGRDIDVKLEPGQTAHLEISLGDPWKLLRIER